MTALELPIAVARELLHRSGALRVSIMVDREGKGRGPVVECARLGPVRVTEEGVTRELAHAAGGDVALPDFPAVPQLPPFEVDPSEGRVAGALGGLESLARALRDLAALIGGRTVVAADYQTDDPQAPLGLAARSGGEPVVVLLGEEAFELDV